MNSDPMQYCCERRVGGSAVLLWLADRNFCTDDYFRGIDDRKAFFLFRHHAGSNPLGAREPSSPEAGVGTLSNPLSEG
jgi:hypothetical protein